MFDNNIRLSVMKTYENMLFPSVLSNSWRSNVYSLQTGNFHQRIKVAVHCYTQKSIFQVCQGSYSKDLVVSRIVQYCVCSRIINNSYQSWKPGFDCSCNSWQWKMWQRGDVHVSTLWSICSTTRNYFMGKTRYVIHSGRHTMLSNIRSVLFQCFFLNEKLNRWFKVAMCHCRVYVADRSIY